MTTGKVIVVSFFGIVQKMTGTTCFSSDFICNFSVTIKNCYFQLIWCFRDYFSRRTPGTSLGCKLIWATPCNRDSLYFSGFFFTSSDWQPRHFLGESAGFLYYMFGFSISTDQPTNLLTDMWRGGGG